MNALFDLLLSPFAMLPPLWGLFAISAIAGVFLVFIYGKVSNQRKLREVKRGIGAALFESILFRRDLKVSLGAQLRMLKGAGSYFLLALPPLAILLVPCVLLLAQLQVRYGLRPLHPGESTLLSVTAKEGVDLRDLVVGPPQSLELSPPVRIPSLHEATWRVQPQVAGSYELTLPSLNAALPLEVAGVTPRLRPLTSRAFWDRVLYPSDLALPESLESISVVYPERDYSVLGVSMHWVILFFVVSLISGLGAAKALHIEV